MGVIGLLIAALCIAMAYLLGSISSTCIVSYLFGRMDMRIEPDGKISAAAVFRRLGVLPFLCVVFMDINLVFLAVGIAGALTHASDIMMLAGFAAVAGHNWSIFLGLRGGLGATAIFGALVAVMPLQICYGVISGGTTWLLTGRPGTGTAVGIIITSCAAFIEFGAGALAVYPLTLFALMLLKRLQVARMPRTIL